MSCTSTKMSLQVYLIPLIVFNFFCHASTEDLSLSVPGMEILVAKQGLLIDNLQTFLDELEEKASLIRQNLEKMRAVHEIARQDATTYVANSLQAYSFFSRVYVDWKHWDSFLREPIGQAAIQNLTEEMTGSIEDADFHQAIVGILRLQDIYGLDPLEMVHGKLYGVQYMVKLSSVDCLSIGDYLTEGRRYAEASVWYLAAIKSYSAQDVMNDVRHIDKEKLLSLYAKSLATSGEIAKALDVINEILTDNPEHTQAATTRQQLEILYREQSKVPEKPKQSVLPLTPYQRGCRGQFPRRDPKLFSMYNSKAHPFLKLAPLKMEVINLDPYVVLYHDIISDSEINVIQEIVKPSLQRAKLIVETDRVAAVHKHRASKVAWLRDDTNEVTKRLSQRLSDMSGLELQLSEDLQVLNYGLAGFYNIHNDFFNMSTEDNNFDQKGDRTGTALIYMTDVELGGATVFTNIEKVVYPKKGTCVVWYNLDSKGDPNPLLTHGACPVIVGSKWVCNKWFRDKEQIFKRPCPRN